MGEALEVFQCPEQRFLSSGSAKRETALLKITQHMTLPQVKASTKSCHSNDLIADFQVLREIREYIYPLFFLDTERLASVSPHLSFDALKKKNFF